MNRLEELKTAIQEAVPEILELKFGCELKNNHSSMNNPHRIGMFVKKFYVPKGRVNSGSTIQMTNGEGDFWEMQEKHLGDCLEILGRPIRLADVLLAMKRLGKDDLRANFPLYEPALHMSDGKIYGDWNLERNTLDEQSEETIDYLHSLLTKRH